MNKNEKMTYVAALSYVLDNTQLPQEVADKIAQLKAAQEKRNSADKKPTKTQLENEGVKETILAELGLHPDAVTVTELQAGNAELKALSNQKVAALVNQLVKDGKIERVEAGRKALFRIIR